MGPVNAARTPDDVGVQLGLVGPGAWAIAALYAAVYLLVSIFFAGTRSGSGPVIVDLCGVVGAAVLLCTPSRTPLPWWRALAVLGIATAVLCVMAFGLRAGHSPGLDAWELGATNFLFFGLALRGRIVVAWAGATISLVVVMVWSLAVTGSVLFGLGFSYGQPVCLLAGTVFAVALHRTAARIAEVRDAEQARAAALARERTDLEVGEQELRVVRRLAGPTLQRIANGESLDPIAIRTLEAELRDFVRGRAFASEPLTSTLRSLRARGVDVTLLDDAGDRRVPRDLLDEIATWASDEIADTRATSVTLRLAWAEGRLTATVAVDGGPSTTFPGGPRR